MLSPHDMRRLAQAYISEVSQKDIEGGNIRLHSVEASRKSEIKFRELARHLVDADFRGRTALDPNEIRVMAQRLGINLSDRDERPAISRLTRELAAFQLHRAKVLRCDQHLEKPGVLQSLLQTLGLKSEPFCVVRIEDQ